MDSVHAPGEGLLLVRHGETALNVARVLQPADTPLSARGLAQARALAARLAAADAPQRIGAIVSSDLPRALQTAQAVGDACGLRVQASALLQERNFGELRGRPYDSLDHDPLASDEAPPGGESRAEFAARCARAWSWLLLQQAQQQSPATALLVVTHGLVLKHWLAQGPLVLPAGLSVPEHLGNTALTRAAVGAPHTVGLLACTAHLGAVGDDARALVGG